MTRRPIPLFKDFGVKAARFEFHEGARRDTVIAFLPGNLQVTPVIDLTATKGGDTIDIWTNHSHWQRCRQSASRRWRGARRS